MNLMPGSLQAFHAVAVAGTVHAAAKKLRLTQAAVTHRLAGLERELGATLFLRSRRGMRLTDAGMSLLDYCRQVIDLEGQTLARMRGVAGAVATHVRFQGPSSILRARVIPRLQDVLGKFPQVTVEFRVADGGADLLALKRGEVDFVVVPAAEVVAEVDSRRLKPERYVLVGPKAWAGRPLAEIVAEERIVDFDPTDAMTANFLARVGLTGRTDRHFVNNTDALAALVEAGLGYSVLALEFASAHLQAGRLIRLATGKTMEHEQALAWYPRRHMPPFYAAVVKKLAG
jgi:DNA-binding transcriptional LysR family regulator